MFKRNICYLLLILVMLTTCIVPAILESSMVHAATNQKQVNGIEYVNKKLGFSLIIPKSWEGNYEIEEDNNLVRFVFTYEGKKNDDIPPLFTIKYDSKKEEGWNEGIRWVSELGTKNNMGYYCYYDALHLYRDSIPPGEEQDTVLNMLGQIPEVFDSFKMLETNETGARGDTAGEVKPKEQGKNGGTAEEETNQETANGIKYINGELGFELTLPKFWKNHYIVKENDSGGVTFKFKFDGKVYDDIYLFNIYVENREYSEEEQETMGDIGVLDVKNGKTYLITENLAMGYYNNYDEYFASVPKEGRDVIKAMSKQKKILNFNVLEGSTAEKVEAKVDDEIPKNYDYYLQPTKVLLDTVSLRVIKTPIDNIRTEVIRKPVSETNYIGINGGYYNPSYDPVKYDPSNDDYVYKPCSMTYYNPRGLTDGSTDGYDFNGCSGKHLSRPTFVTYYDKDLKKTKAEIIDAKSIDEIKNHFENLDKNDHQHHSNQVIINAIGGKGFDPEHIGLYPITWEDFSSWESFKQKFTLEYFNNQMQFSFPLPVRRTVLGFQEEDGTIYAYLMITLEGVSIKGMETRLKELGFDKNNIILLDGSGSSSMRVYDKKINDWVVDIGTEPSFSNSIPNANRYAYNMIRLIE
ncbi:hypothetical protein NKR74_05095 [Bacillus sp. 3103sda1]|uniref:hypothetical protein n=1 Tax=Bacillus sp. 3103sda1 TaxID=2953808 RepID=UPI00209C8F98|nr:hypothetical protein [Bacillus sp. 3103sda1]MCP1122722.1 hypothetical protein [Bacillus sp. 3103sda1]